MNGERRFRAFDPVADREAVRRILREVGWLTEEAANKQANDLWLESSGGLVAELSGEPECLAATVDGTLRYLDEDLPFSAVVAVVTGRVARRQGLATGLTAQAVAEAAGRGAAVVGLGTFDLGFYDRLGFGTGIPARVRCFDPADLRVEAPRRLPVRLSVDDWERLHACRTARLRRHGAATLAPAVWTRSEALFCKNGFGLGFEDDDGVLTHHVFCEAEAPESGPLRVGWLAWRTPEQLRELLGVLAALGDQVHLVRMVEPPGVDLRDLLSRPQRRARVGAGEPPGRRPEEHAPWQVRIVDLADCLERTRLPDVVPVTFNLTLTDPLTALLPAGSEWRGVAGDWVVTLGPESCAQPGPHRADLPTLRASVGTFTRLWLGVRPPTGLACTAGDLEASPGLLEGLERRLRLPEPQPDWEF